jgi:hypothetical protein
MSRNPFLVFHRAAEAEGYPAMLLVTMVSLTIMVVAIALLALMQTGWTFAMALLSLIVAIAILAGEVDAALRDAGPLPARRAAARSAFPETKAVVPLPRRDSDEDQRGRDRKAA